MKTIIKSRMISMLLAVCMAVSLLAVPAYAADYNYTYYSQNGWTNNKGTTLTGMCYLTSLAMLISDLGKKVTPVDVYYANDSVVNCNFSKICKYYGLSYTKEAVNTYTNEAEKRQKIVEVLSSGKYPAGVLVIGRTNGANHMVVARRVVNGTIYCDDPVNGQNIPITSTWRAADNIISYWMFTPTSKWSSSGAASPSPAANNTNKLSVSSVESGEWSVTIPANYKLLLYSESLSNNSATYCSARESSYRVVCKEKATLSNGAIRYRGRFNTDDSYWFVYNSSMAVKDDGLVTSSAGNTVTPPGKPSKPSISVSSQSVSVSWTCSRNATKYDVYLVQTPWRWEDIKYQGSTTDTSYTFENVQEGEYRTFVIARPNADTVQSDWAEFTVSSQTANTAAQTVVDGVYALEPQCAPGLRLDVAGASAENKTNIQIYHDNGTSAQRFEFTHTGDGYYSITAKTSGKCLDVQEGKKASGTNVWQYNPNATDAQKWMLEDAGDGYYYIIPKLNTGLCLDVSGAKNANGTNVQVYNRNQTNAQKWALIPSDTTAAPPADTSGEGCWGAWSEWSANYAEESAARQVERRQVKISDGHTEYRYGRFVDSTGTKVCWCKKYLESWDSVSGSAVLQYSDWSANKYAANGTHWGCGFCNGEHIGVDFKSEDGRAWWARYELPGGYYYWEETRSVDAQYETQYRYCDWISG